MFPKPAYLTKENAARFEDASVVERYPFRLPYPDETFDILVGLITDEPRTVLDVGTGTGDMARSLVTHVERVDAVDRSEAMIRKGKTLPQGKHPGLRWINGEIEQVELHPPYALITAGESLHWMNWEVVLPRFHYVLTPHGQLAIVYREEVPPSWQDGLDQLIDRYSTIRNYEAFDLIEELEKRQLFQKSGEHLTAPVTSTISIEHYIASFHSRSSLSLEHMPPADATAFDTGVRELVEPWSNEGYIQLECIGSVVWGRPLVPEQ
jgi:ubiquinone/menaquinone biosynthesis C-methylase UbiE